MKKVICFALVAFMMFAFISCGDNKTTLTPDNSKVNSPEETYTEETVTVDETNTAVTPTNIEDETTVVTEVVETTTDVTEVSPTETVLIPDENEEA